ncbi:hypothetical protein ADICYQ_5554 [Cyclobacterium qasimii M12-11B]|uniref:Uncharacterized protein n=1 Tax=Cyclobacterium qasimii M12-11B TaxID=641524 RepID=S7WML1_9BACT|nr:hypothetical protein ADICYQ_5554 [Cyclobacterium qasimii M12-11B]
MNLPVVTFILHFRYFNTKSLVMTIVTFLLQAQKVTNLS